MNTWRKASFCNSGECVEVASGDEGAMLLRDSKAPDDGALSLSRANAAALVAAIKAGDFDHLT